MTKPFYIDWSQQPSDTAVWCEGIGVAMKSYSGWHEIGEDGNYYPVFPTPSGFYTPWLKGGEGEYFEVFRRQEAAKEEKVEVKKIDWTKAPAGSEAARVCFDDYVEFYKTVDNVFCFWSENEQQWNPAFTQQDDKKLLWKHEKPEQKKPWHESGELPPVGERVLMVGNEHSSVLAVADAARFNDHLGQEVKIVAHSIAPLTNKPIAVYEVLVDTDTRYGYDYHAMVANCFKPLPTEEEKAAAAKEAFIKEAHAVCLDGGSWGLHYMLERLYDAGYRKQEDAQ